MASPPPEMKVEVAGMIPINVFIEIGYQLGMAIEEASRTAHNSGLSTELIIEKGDAKIIFRVNK